MAGTDRQLMQASAVAIDGAGLLILGASGSGKSSLALQLLAFGAVLIADDQCQIEKDGDRLILSPPPRIAGLIEARGVGILAAPTASATPLSLVALMDAPEIDRLPPMRTHDVLGQSMPVLHNTGYASFPAAVLQYLRHGRRA